VNSSANNPSSRGNAERAVGQVKILLKKLLATASSNSLNWELLPYLVSKLMNHTVCVQTGFKPAEMIFGQDKMSQAFFDREKLLPAHHTVSQNKESIKSLTENLREMSKMAQESLIQLRQENHEKVNRTRIDKPFKVNDIVFVLDRYILPGNSRPLKTKFYPSPFVVLKPYFTTCLVRRLADNFTALYSMDDLKLYKGTDPIFSTLPPEVNKVLLHDFRDLVDSDFLTILKHDPLNIPTGLPLIDTVAPKPPNDQEIFSKIEPVQYVQDEFAPDDIFLPLQDSAPARKPPDPDVPDHDAEEDGAPEDIVEYPLRPMTRSRTANEKKYVENKIINKELSPLPTDNLFLEPIAENDENLD
jgi:hypothetical protein